MSIRPKFQEELASLLENKVTFPVENINIITSCVLLVVLVSRKKRGGRERKEKWKEVKRREESGKRKGRQNRALKYLL